MLKKVVRIIVWLLLVELVGYFLGGLTQHDIETWYLNLQKPYLTPPNIVFPIVWSVLYFMIALSGCWLWEKRRVSKTKLALTFYSLQLFLNWCWSPLFFNFHLIGLSLICIGLISIFTVITIILAWDGSRLSSITLIPYLLWLVYASYLNAALWVLN